MSRQDHKASLPEWIRQKLADLRQQATEPEEWPETADRLLKRLTQQTSPQAVDESDMDMFSLAVQDTLSGVDISQRYPAFFEKMVANPVLYQAFLDALSILEDDSRRALTPVPKTTEGELSFLKEGGAAQPSIEQSTPDAWRITWKLLLAQLQQLLFPASDLVFRRNTPLLEDESIILLHDEVVINGRQVETVLEAIRPVAEPEILRLQVMVAGEAALPPLEASLNWGAYTQTAVLDNFGRAHFPPLALDNILDETGQLRAEDLQLVIEILPNS